MILLVADTSDDLPTPASLEALAAARQIDPAVTAVVLGRDTAAAADAAARLPVTEIIRLEHPALGTYTPDGTVAELAGLVGSLAPSHVVLPHTYQARDFVPRLAARLAAPLLTECTGIATVEGRVTFARPIFQGKVVADIVLDGPAPHIVTVQIGAFRADDLPTTTAPAPIRQVPAAITDADIRQVVEPPFRDAQQEVDLSTATRIVAVGRGVKDETQLAMVRQLATALGAEIAASRPLCDAGWLPMDRQIGSSGQTVAPQLYIALGISGAIQHIVGMKGAKTIVAVNTDADAPIFEIADYGIVGDLFDVVPALVAALEAR
ncbi:MAG: hypothetical protein ABS36_11530 [Acidobacteria bacterium SCN 69-37]|nr:MAG: hypothetical protein ABS36_11530 [Acidobacteria bacterium SCN 69-37]